MLEFVDSDLYIVQDKNNFIKSLLKVGSGSVEKNYRIRRTKNHRIRILIPVRNIRSRPNLKCGSGSKDIRVQQVQIDAPAELELTVFGSGSHPLYRE